MHRIMMESVAQRRPTWRAVSCCASAGISRVLKSDVCRSRSSATCNFWAGCICVEVSWCRNETTESGKTRRSGDLRRNCPYIIILAHDVRYGIPRYARPPVHPKQSFKARAAARHARGRVGITLTTSKTGLYTTLCHGNRLEHVS